MPPKLIIEVAGDVSNLQKSLKMAGRSTDTFGSKMSRSLGNIAKAGVFAGAAAGVGGLTVALRAGISEFSESSKVSAQLGAVLRSTGGVANVTAKQVDSLSLALLNKSGVDDEAVKSGANMLLTFTNIRNEVGRGNDVFNQTTRTLLDMSVATGQDMPKAAVMLGKAINDPIAGIGALSRVGVTFTEGQRESIKAMVATGDVMGAQKVILAELTKEFGGSARAAGQELPGKLKILRENLSNVAGAVVGEYTPAFERATDSATKWIQSSENQTRVLAEVREAVTTVREVLGTLADVTRSGAGAVERFSDVMGGAKNAVVGLGLVIAGLKFRGMISGLSGVEGQARAASTQVGGLRGRFQALGTMNPVVLTIGLALTPQAVSLGKRLAKWTGGNIFGDDSSGFLIPGHSANDLAAKAARKAEAAKTHLMIDPLTGAVSSFQLGTASTPAAKRATSVITKLAESQGAKLGEAAAAALAKGASKGVTKRVGGMFYADGIGALAKGAKTLAGIFDTRDFAAGNQRRQFMALGLTTEGGERAPTIKGLRAMLGNLEGDVKGTPLDTSKMRSRFAVMRKIISGEFGKAREDVRRTMKGMLDDIEGQLGDRLAPSGFRHGSPNKLAEALGLGGSRAATRRSAAILSQVGRGGMVPGRQSQAFSLAGGGTTIHIENFHSSAQNVRQFEAEMVKRARSRPQPRRGSR